MDLRSLPPDLSPAERCEERRRRIEAEFTLDLSALRIDPEKLGHAEARNCEQMFGVVPLPVGLAGPLTLTLSNGEEPTVHLPLATTEAALVASVNRGCKALSGAVKTSSQYHGMTRSIALAVPPKGVRSFLAALEETRSQWTGAAEATSAHLRLLSAEIEAHGGHVFLTFACDTDEAMGMNMVTIAAQAAGNWIGKHVCPAHGAIFVTVASNVDSDKKPSRRTHDRGRGYEAWAEALLPRSTVEAALRSTPEAMHAVAEAKLRDGSALAGAIGENLHAANVVAALFLATGQDAGHVVEGSLTDTTVTLQGEDLRIAVRCPALLLGIRGGGTTLPAQSQCLSLLLGRTARQSRRTKNPFDRLRAGQEPRTPLHPCQRLAEIVAAVVLAGETSLLAAQASHTLASSHARLAR
jgi:hydroxymethylglutaryl-CoA reductase (NADPH)